MKKLRSICMFLLLLVSMLSLPLSVVAVDFNKVLVDGVEVVKDGAIVGNGIKVVERGDDVEIRIELTNLEFYEGVRRVTASIHDYEYGVISDSTVIDTESSTGVYTTYLHLQLPDDIEVGDYPLKLEITGGLGTSIDGVVLQVIKPRHELSIQDVILRPTSTVEAGRPLAVEVRVENMGSIKEEDIKISVSIKDLGVSTRAYLDELGNVEDKPEDDETSDSLTLYLPIPADAVSGEYDLDVDVEYSGGHDVVSTKTKVYVQGTQAKSKTVDTIISLDAVSKSVVKGGLVTYRLMLANLGDSETVYSLAVEGTSGWADVSLSPGFVRVAANSAGELTLTVKALATGEHSFTLKVRQNDKTLRDVTLNTSVSESKSHMYGVRSVLEIGFAVLVALLVILGLVVAFKKLGRRDEKEPEPIMDNGQSYY